jgi:hypothetical protein
LKNQDGSPQRDRGFVSYVTEFMALVDFCAIAPAYVELVFEGEGGGFGAYLPMQKAGSSRMTPPRQTGILSQMANG